MDPLFHYQSIEHVEMPKVVGHHFVRAERTFSVC